MALDEEAQSIADLLNLDLEKLKFLWKLFEMSPQNVRVLIEKVECALV